MTTPQSSHPQSQPPVRPRKRRRTQSTSADVEASAARPNAHFLHHTQPMAAATEPAPQDPVFAQAQLLRSICAALAVVGYDTVRPSALESFRANVEQYMLSFLAQVKTSMHSSRRSSPTPQDFTYALKALDITSSDLDPHVDLPLPKELAAPVIAPPKPAEPSPLNLASMLGTELHTSRLSGNEFKDISYIPSHFPPLPSRHSYLCTPVFTKREQDARKIRERATEEGILAERALRKLTSARLGRGGRGTSGGDKAKVRDEHWRTAMADLLDDDQGADDTMSGTRNDHAGLGEGSFALDDLSDERENEKVDAVMRSGGLNVNHDTRHWRRGTGAAVR